MLTPTASGDWTFSTYKTSVPFSTVTKISGHAFVRNLRGSSKESNKESWIAYYRRACGDSKSTQYKCIVQGCNSANPAFFRVF
eukprot:CFRG4223T1